MVFPPHLHTFLLLLRDDGESAASDENDGFFFPFRDDALDDEEMMYLYDVVCFLRASNWCTWDSA